MSQALAVAEGNASVVFGIVFDINGQLVPISTDQLDVSKGFDFELPGPVKLGSFNDLFDWLKTTFGVEIPGADKLPPPLDTIVEKITSMIFAVEQLHVFVPPRDSKDPKKYTLRISGTWTEGEEPELIGIKIKGGVFGASNEKTE